MKDPLSPDVEKLLQDLQLGQTFNAIRITAARKLGELSASNPQIVKALITAIESDPALAVRRKAWESLQAPMHWEILEQYPDLMEKVREIQSASGLSAVPKADTSTNEKQSLSYLDESFLEPGEDVEDLDEALVEQIYVGMKQENTGELLRIWKERNTEEWTREAFEAIRRVLVERGPDITAREYQHPTTNHQERERGGCLTLWLVGVMGYSLLGWVFEETTINIIICGVNFVVFLFAIALWNWKRWGAYALGACCSLTFFIGLWLENVWIAAQALPPAALLYLLVRPKWHLMD